MRRKTGRSVVGNGSIRPPKLNNSLTSARQWREKGDVEQQQHASEGTPKPSRKLAVPNIWAAVRIIFEKDIGPLMGFMSVFVMVMYAMLIPLQDVIRRQYDFNDLQVGLCYIPFSVGSVAGSVFVGKLLNWHYARVARDIGVTADRKKGDDLRNFPIERARLDLMWPWIAIAVVTVVAWGWVVDSGTNLAAPLVVMFFSGVGQSGPMSILSTLLVDLYPSNPGRVSSSFNLTRASMSAVGSAVVQYMIDAWGYGYTYLFLGLLLLVTSPVVLIVRIWGPKWREERYQRLHG